VRAVTIARNYADTLFALASESGDLEEWGQLIDTTAAAMMAPSIEVVLMSPRVPRDQKIAIFASALADAPKRYVLFISAVIRRGRQVLIGSIADEYRDLTDQKLGRVRAGVTLSREVADAMKTDLVAKMSAAIGKEVIAGFAVDPKILGGAVIRIGDRIYDGSVRRKLGRLRQELLTTDG
jgi:F-type H+-transporting ATPase subunit delta